MRSAIKSDIVREFEKTGKVSVPVIDVHTHMDDVYGASMPISDIDGCIELANERGVKEIWCAPHGDLFNYVSGKPDIERYTEKYPTRVRGYFGFNPNYSQEYAQRLETAKDKGYFGIKILPEYHRCKVDDDAYRPALEWANKYRRPLLVHTWGGSPFNSIANVKYIAESYPEIRLILGHSAPNECGKAIELAARHKNVYLDLCDIHRNNGVIERMKAGAGSEKILYGTDLPWYDFAYCIGSVLYSDITDGDRENILYKNAERIVGEIVK